MVISFGAMTHSKLTYNSKRYVTLCYAKMIQRPFSKDNLKNCLAGTWNNTSSADMARSLDFLCKSGLLKKVDKDQWQITEDGESALFDTARRSRHIRRSPKFEDLSDQFLLLRIGRQPSLKNFVTQRHKP